MFVKVLFSALAAAQIVFGTPIRSRTPYSVKEKHHVPAKWTQRDRAPKDYTINLKIGVKQSQFDELERHLYEGVKDPAYWVTCHNTKAAEQSRTLTMTVMDST